MNILKKISKTLFCQKFLGILFTTLLLKTSVSYAKEVNVFDYPSSKLVISDLKNQIPQPDKLSGNFEQIKTVTEINKNFISSGEFSFSKNNGLNWNIKKPFISNLIFTKDQLIKIDENGNKTILENNQPVFKEISNIFRSLFSGDYEKMEEYFDIFFTKDKDIWIIGLKPNSDSIKDSIDAIIIKGGDNIQEILFQEAYGDKTLIKFYDTK